MKLKVLIDLKVVCVPPYTVGKWSRTNEEKARRLDEWCKEFEDFVRDHRSQDPISLSVEREYQDQCSHCTSEWETDDEGRPVCCNKAQKEFEEKHANLN